MGTAVALILAAVAPLVGDWTGTIRGPAGVWHVHVAITQDTILHASVDFPDANVYERPFSVTASGSVVRFERPQPGSGRARFRTLIL